MFDLVMDNPSLFAIRREECRDEGISVEFCERLRRSDRDILILKVDEFYNSLNIKSRPKSVDCLILVNRAGRLNLILVELRNVGSAKSIQPDDIEPKFINTLNDFMGERFRDVFDQLDISSMELKLAANPWGIPEELRHEFLSRTKGTVVERYLLRRPITYRGMAATIQVEMPGLEIC